LVSHHISEHRPWLQNAAQGRKLLGHAAKVQPRNPVIHPFETGRFTHPYPPFFNFTADRLNPLIARNPSLIIIALINAAGIGPHKEPLQTLKFGSITDEPKHDIFKPGGPGVILLVRIRRRSENCIDRGRWNVQLNISGIMPENNRFAVVCRTFDAA
jgi:hypothetical protein